jgi:S1-C subfamily serine protease
VGPAAKAGVKGGDIILKLAGKEVKNIYDYTYLMGDLKIGEETEIVVKRDGKEVVMKVTPQSRD